MSTRTLIMTGGFAAALLIAAAAAAPAQAGGIRVTSCIGGWYGGVSCITRWGRYGNPHIRYAPSLRSAEEEALVAERERRWTAHCRPVVRYDRYGVARYQYAARGCEHGVVPE
jgi:hypothetical protein